MPIILAADTATSINTVAVCRDQAVLAEVAVDCHRRHSESLLDTCAWLLDQAECTLQQVDVFAVSVGPGSFTGVRIGTATFKGLAGALRRPLIAVPTLDALARVYPLDEGLVCPLLDARMGEVYGAVYRVGAGRREKLTHDRVGAVEELLADVEGPALFVGDGATLYRERILEQVPSARFAPSGWQMPRAAAVAAEALDLLDRGCSTDAALVEPVYLRASQAEINRARQLRQAAQP
jgi:tRNA threonylcarbamoyl adenosine modification protein YeaZ